MNTISKRTIAVALMAVLSLGLSTCKKENIEIIARPTVKLFHEATITDYTKASVTAEVIDEGGAAVTERGFVYGLLDGDTIAIPCGSGKGVYLQDLSNLQPSTTYVYWAYAINAGGYGTSPKFNFTTKDNLKPIVMTGEQVSVTTTTAVIGGNKVTNDGGDHVTERGVCYSTDSIQLTVSGVRVPAGEDIGEFSCRLEDLTPNTTYYYCAYAKNSKGTGYGDTKSFLTEALPTYTIEVSANPSNGGVATGNGTFDEGQRCTVVATPNTGYNFVNWTDENNVQVYDSVRYTFEVSENRNLVAHFTAQAYTIRATVEPEGSGTIEGVGGYNYGDQCTLIATPKPGYAFEEWREDGNHIDASANYPFTVTGDRNLVAHFRVAEFNLAVSANPMIIPQGDNSQLDAEASGGNGNFTYSWSPASSLNNATIQNPTASPVATTTYTCTTTSAAGSTESGSCTVTVVCPPTDLTATVQNTNQVHLTWTAPSTVTSYRIYRNNTLIKSDYTSTTYTDSNLGAGTYSYQVTAVYQNVESPKSNEASATVYGSLSVTATASPNTIPNGSSSTLTATASGGNGSYTYSWTPTTGLSNSHVQSPTASPSTTTTYTVTVSSNGQSATANVTVNVVRAPTNLTATVQNTNQVRLSWTAPNTVTSYKVYRNNTLIKSGLTTTTYTDSNLGAGTYSYQVTAIYNNVESPKSNEASATVYSSLSVTATASPNTIPNGSSSTLTATASGGNGSYTYSWTPTTGLSNSHVQSPTASPSTTTTYTVTVSSNGQSATANVTVYVVSAPTNLQYIVNGSTVNLTWTVPNTYSYFKVYRNGSPISGNIYQTSYSDSNLNSGTYNYYVTAIYNNVSSPPSNTVQVTIAPQAPTGAINGLFTINNSGDKVWFSQGNLQYNPALGSHQCADGTIKQGTWRFATNQWDYVDYDDVTISQYYNGWLDKFGWGTSGWDCGNTHYCPWDIILDSGSSYGPPGSHNLTDSYAYSDWGVYNAIINGGNQPGRWRTLVKSEWNYVFNLRSTSTGIHYAKAQVNGVNGVILLPDNWSTSYYSLSNTDNIDANYNSNEINSSLWINSLESHGAVFLPVNMLDGGSNEYRYGAYWTATCDEYVSSAIFIEFYSDSKRGLFYITSRCVHHGVRLVCPVEN